MSKPTKFSKRKQFSKKHVKLISFSATLTSRLVRTSLIASQNLTLSSSHITSFNCSRFVVDGGNSLRKLKHPFMWISSNLRNSPISFGKCLMLRQLNMSRSLEFLRPVIDSDFLRLVIDSGNLDKSVQDLSLSTSKFTSFPISLGSVDS